MTDLRRAYLWLFLLIVVHSGSFAQLDGINNPTAVLEKLPNFSTFNRLLAQTGVASEIQQRSSLTILMPQNSVLDALTNRSNLPLPLVADVLRYHVLLQYQATGRAEGQNGFVNVSVAPDGAIHLGLPFANNFNATLQQNVTQFPYNVSYMQIDQVLVPSDLGRPQAAAASILNFTTSLQRSERFNTFLNLMQTTGLTALLASLPSFSVFVPTDDAFQAIPKETMDKLAPSQASSLLAYHAVPAYTSFSNLQKQNSFVQTVASNGNNQRFLLQVSSPGGASGAVSLSTGVNFADVVSSIYDQAPAVAYSINRVLLPKEIFILASEANAPGGAPASAPVPPAAPILSPEAAMVPPPPSQQQVDAPASPPAPVVDVGNLPPASGPGDVTESSQNSAAPKSLLHVSLLMMLPLWLVSVLV